MTIPQLLVAQLHIALQKVLGEKLPQDLVLGISPSANLNFGDYQSNVAMMLAKRVGMNPRALATELIESIAELEIATLEIAGPGFINFRIKPEFYAARMQSMLGDERLGVAQVENPKRIVIDFSAPNVAKPMHIGHIRSTIIGDSLTRLARFMGHEVITDNHIGDWGTQFGMILWGWKNVLDVEALKADPIEELLNLYKTVTARCKEEEGILTLCKAELVKLQANDEENLAIWHQCIAVTKSGLEGIYDTLNIKFDYWLGESAYNDALAPLVNRLIEQGIARESDGAICVFSDNKHEPKADPLLVQKDGEWQAVPAIIRKADGAFLYATTDLATIDYRLEHFKADSIWYVVGIPQEKHFKQIFDVMRMQGITGDFRHVGFGSIMGKDHKPFKTRSGDTVSLSDVINEAISRAAKVVEEKSPDMPAEERAAIAQIVGIGAIKFAELSQNRMSDYVFDWDRMLALSGDTAPYLQNSYVRVRSIFRRTEQGTWSGNADSLDLKLEAPAEIHLARLLSRFAELVPATLDDCRPNILASYLFELARAFHSFYEACPVLRSEGAIRESRLALCELTARVLKQGMGLFGIEMPERM